MEVDYTKWDAGVVLGAESVLVECPVCKRPCLAKVTKAGAKYIHAVSVERVYPSEKALERKRGENRDPLNRFQLSDPEPKARGRNKAVPTHFCKHTRTQRLAYEETLRQQRERGQRSGARP